MEKIKLRRTYLTKLAHKRKWLCPFIGLLYIIGIPFAGLMSMFEILREEGFFSDLAEAYKIIGKFTINHVDWTVFDEYEKNGYDD